MRPRIPYTTQSISIAGLTDLQLYVLTVFSLFFFIEHGGLSDIQNITECVNRLRNLFHFPNLNDIRHWYSSDESASYYTVLHYIARRGDEHLTNLFLRNNWISANVVNLHGVTPLHLAAYHGYSRTVHALLNGRHNAADPNCCDASGNTPLFYAVQNGYFNTVELLLHWGAIDSPNHSGARPSDTVNSRMRHIFFNTAQPGVGRCCCYRP